MQLYRRVRNTRGLAQRGFIAMGDAAMAFNAFHGQGTRMAALSATTLSSLLSEREEEPRELSRSFHRAQWRTLKTARDVAVGMDLQWPETSGERPLSFRLLRAFGVEGTRAACEDPEVKKSLAPVLQLIDSPYSTLRPGLMARILWLSLKRRLLERLVLAEVPTCRGSRPTRVRKRARQRCGAHGLQARRAPPSRSLSMCIHGGQ
jgi:2-polyprenyl-6-methoxyphenol hydroxylase-like FAD-dependent oxidoreductase